MPDTIYNWSSTRDEARFTVQNMAKLALRIDRRIENSEVRLIPLEKTPFDVILRWELSSQGDNQTVARLIIEADLNMMMKMVAVKPLQQLVDHQVDRLRLLMA